jgi:beta-lactamase regulating signal transducer with metallopeptidase domain
MIANLMTYGIAVTLLLGAAGLALERVAAARRLPRRAVWAAALALSVALPLLNAMAPHRVPVPATPAIPSLSLVSPTLSGTATDPTLRPVTAMSMRTTDADKSAFQSVPTSAQVENSLRWLWALTSTGLFALYVILSVLLWAAARRWQRHDMDGQVVWVTENMGPAVVGFIHPKILMPRWSLEVAQNIRTFVLAHEQEHVRAGDQWLVQFGLIANVMAPWNLAMWWVVRRMRFAIEVDCDTRVLAQRADPRAYGEALLSVGRRHTQTPVVAIALTEPASQLLRRIRIMTSSLPKRRASIVGATLGAALTCAAVAAQLQAPVMQNPTIVPPATSQLPLKPPFDGRDPWGDRALASARTVYPELLRGAAPDGHIFVTVALKSDGTVFKATKDIVGPEDWSHGATDQAAYDRVGVYPEQLQFSGITGQEVSAGSPIAFTVTYAVLKPEPELTRLRMLRKAVMERFAQSFRALTESGPKPNMLTVFMTDSGDIDKAQVGASPDQTHAEPLLTTARFSALGVDPNRVGLIGKTMMLDSPSDKGGPVRGLFVVFGWPRHEGESGPTIIPDDSSRPSGVNPAVDLAIVERYFPDAFAAPESPSTPLPWVLLDRAGKVLGAGRLQFTNSYVLSRYLEAIYPGTKVQDYSGGPVVNAKGERATVSFLWLAPDSPVTDLSRVDATKRSDVFLTVTLTTADNPYPLEIPMALKYGVPTMANGSGALQLQAVATDASASYVDIEMQLYSNDSTAALSWAPNAPKLRIDYGTDASMTFQDEKKRSWRVAIRPERLASQRT